MTGPEQEGGVRSDTRVQIDRFAAGFRVLRLRVRVRIDGGATLPAYKGSMLRSILIDRLRARLCRRLDRESCGGCPDAGHCRYPPLGQPESWVTVPPRNGTPPPGLFHDPPLNFERYLGEGAALEFAVVLVGDRCADLTPLVDVIRSLESEGFGEDRGRARVESITVAGATREVPLVDVAAVEAVDLRALDDAGRVDVELVTPLLFKEGNRVAETLTAETFLRAVRRRLIDLGAVHAPHLSPLPRTELMGSTPEMLGASLRWYEGARHSRRQDTHTPVHGILGHFSLRGDFSLWGPLLALGELTHVGKNAALGLGQYRLHI